MMKSSWKTAGRTRTRPACSTVPRSMMQRYCLKSSRGSPREKNFGTRRDATSSAKPGGVSGSLKYDTAPRSSLDTWNIRFLRSIGEKRSATWLKLILLSKALASLRYSRYLGRSLLGTRASSITRFSTSVFASKVFWSSLALEMMLQRLPMVYAQSTPPVSMPRTATMYSSRRTGTMSPYPIDVMVMVAQCREAMYTAKWLHGVSGEVLPLT
mmetsp:Transcript_19637/g.53969  ORF Transcript_19637/g.53969 Transcript_19637/m.53969 type:complete len:212 (-) Transcript_19637:1309-1944(-)